MARFIVAGNWKMNGSFESIDTILANLKQASIPQGTGEPAYQIQFLEVEWVRDELTRAASGHCHGSPAIRLRLTL